MRLATCSCNSCWQIFDAVENRLLAAPRANCNATSRMTCGRTAVPVPVVTAPTTASMSNLDSQARAAGIPPCNRLSSARDTVSGALASQTSASTRRKPLQVVAALAHMAEGDIDGPPPVSPGTGGATTTAPLLVPLT